MLLLFPQHLEFQNDELWGEAEWKSLEFCRAVRCQEWIPKLCSAPISCQAQAPFTSSGFLVWRDSALWFKVSLHLLFSSVEKFIGGLVANQLQAVVASCSLCCACLCSAAGVKAHTWEVLFSFCSIWKINNGTKIAKYSVVKHKTPCGLVMQIWNHSTCKNSVLLHQNGTDWPLPGGVGSSVLSCCASCRSSASNGESSPQISAISDFLSPLPIQISKMQSETPDGNTASQIHAV